MGDAYRSCASRWRCYTERLELVGARDVEAHADVVELVAQRCAVGVKDQLVEELLMQRLHGVHGAVLARILRRERGEAQLLRVFVTPLPLPILAGYAGAA